MKTGFLWLTAALTIWAVATGVSAQENAPGTAAPGAPVVIASPEAPASQPTERIEATVEQLEQLINAPPEARLGREIDEPEQPFTLFADKKRIEDLLGENPRYVYVPQGTDPMIVPWVRNRVMAAELVGEAKELMASAKYFEAMAKVDLVLERFGDSDSAEKAREIKMQLERYMQNKVLASETPKTPIGPTPRTLPIWIPENTRGIIFDVEDPGKSSVLIGEYILHVGQSIPSFPGIKVVGIDRSVVTLDYQGEVFRLPVEGVD